MNNLKKVGLTALAGSLAASTAYAGVLEVTGSASVKFLGLTSAYTAGSEKAILIGGTFANNTDSSVNIWVEVHDSSSNTIAGIGQKIPVPTGSSFVISDAGKTLLEATDSVRVYCDTANGVDVALSILKGVS